MAKTRIVILKNINTNKNLTGYGQRQEHKTRIRMVVGWFITIENIYNLIG